MVEYFQLFLALVLLLLPRGWLRLGPKIVLGSRKRTHRTPGLEPFDGMMRLREEVGKLRNWVDFFRAAMGAWALAELLPKLAGTESYAFTALFWAMAVAAILGCVAQTVRRESRISLFAPVFYLQGWAVGLFGPLEGLLSMITGWALSPVAPGPSTFLLLQAFVAAVVGLLLLEAELWRVAIIAFVTLLPALIAVLFRRRLNASLAKKPKIVVERSRRSESAAATQ